MTTEFFRGPEFDWLRASVQAVTWDGTTRPRRPAPPRPDYDDDAEAYIRRRQQLVHRVEEVVRVTAAGGVLEQKPRVVAETVRRADVPPAGMTPAEYNTWRAQSPSRREAYPYVHQEYPKMLRKDGEEPIVVQDATDHQRKLKQGWQ